MPVQPLIKDIFSIDSQHFDGLALEMFQYQRANNEVYRTWVESLGSHWSHPARIEEIPFLPISFFKSHPVKTGPFEPAIVFESSGTTGTNTSRHYVKDVSVYQESFTRGFQLFYGDPASWCVIGLLPSYLERSGSSLVMMVDELVRMSGHPLSGFYLDEFERLHDVLLHLNASGQRTLLIGVTFALLDFAAQYPMQLDHVTVMETGGMKGRRKEMIRPEVHAFLQAQLGVQQVHSEYGMTELLSQAYSSGEGLFQPVPWMKVLVRDEDDPLSIHRKGRGLINIIDLANLHSCSFIATDDVARLYDDGSFEVLGRMDQSDVRGCSLMAL